MLNVTKSKYLIKSNTSPVAEGSNRAHSNKWIDSVPTLELIDLYVLRYMKACAQITNALEVEVKEATLTAPG